MPHNVPERTSPWPPSHCYPSPHIPGREGRIISVDYYYPTVSLSILTLKGRCTVRVGNLPQLKVPLLAGRDCSLYMELWQMMLCTGQRGSGLSIIRQVPGHRRGAGKQRKKKNQVQARSSSPTIKRSLGIVLWSRGRNTDTTPPTAIPGNLR